MNDTLGPITGGLFRNELDFSGTPSHIRIARLKVQKFIYPAWSHRYLSKKLTAKKLFSMNNFKIDNCILFIPTAATTDSKFLEIV